MSRHSEGIDFYYANASGTQNNGKNLFLFDGGSTIFRDGKKIAKAGDFQEGVLTKKGFSPVIANHEVVWQSKKMENSFSLDPHASLRESLDDINKTPELETILQGIITGFKSAFEATKAKKFVIGLSG